MKRDFFYRLYDLSVSSDLELPLFNENFSSKNEIDIQIFQDDLLNLKAKGNKFSSNLKEVKLEYPKIGVVKISNQGTKISYNFSKKNFNLISKIINHAFGYAIYQKKELALHSSAIKTSRGSILFLGSPGSGKSSIAASFSSVYPLISEDTLRVKSSKNKLISVPGPSFLKLNDKISSLLNYDSSNSFYIDERKRKYFKSKKIYKTDSKIHSCYFLKWGENFEIKKISDFKEKLGIFISSCYSSFPFNSCPVSSSILLKYADIFFNQVNFYLLTRNKKNFFSNNKKIEEHFLNLSKYEIKAK